MKKAISVFAFGLFAAAAAMAGGGGSQGGGGGVNRPGFSRHL